jgi:hypothetical protein
MLKKVIIVLTFLFMMIKFWQLSVSPKKIFLIMLNLVPQLSIFFLLRTFFLDQILENAGLEKNTALLFKGVYLGILALSAFLGSFFLIQIQRRTFFIISFLYRVIAIISILFFKTRMMAIVPCFLLGSSFGLGFPSDLAFLADNVDVEVRGRVSGFTLFSTFIFVMSLLMLSSGFEFSIFKNTLAIFILQFTSIGVLFLYSDWDRLARIPISIRKIRENKKFTLYLIPWILFSLANGIMTFLSAIIEVSELTEIATLVMYLSSCIFCIIAGVISDYYGRKPALLIGFVILGIVYSVVPYMKSPAIDVFSSLLTGMAWSFIMVSFLFTIVGDIGPLGCREIYYAISGIMWMVIETSMAFVSSVVTLQFPITIVSSILSLSMFLSVIPLLYASETIPQNKLVDRRLSNYFENVLKLLEVKEE